MKENSTILLRKEVIEMLKKARDYPRQTYNELIENMVKIFLRMKQTPQVSLEGDFAVRNSSAVITLKPVCFARIDISGSVKCRMG